MVKEGAQEELLDEEGKPESREEKKPQSGWKQSKYTPEELKKAKESVDRRGAMAENSGEERKV